MRELRRHEIEVPQGVICVQGCNTEYANIGVHVTGRNSVSYYRYDLPELIFNAWKESYGTQQVVVAPWELQPQAHNDIVQGNKADILALIERLNRL